MKNSTLILLLIIFLAIGGLAFAAYQQFKGFRDSIYQIKLPGFEIPEANLKISPEENQEQKEFIAPDQKLKLEYPEYWMEMEETGIQKTLTSEKAQTLLFAYRLNPGELVFSFLVLQKLNWEDDLEEIINEMEKDIEKRGGKMDILNLNLGKKEADFEARYNTTEGNLFYSKEKLILTDQSCYLVAIFFQEENRLEISQEVNSILNSIQVIE